MNNALQLPIGGGGGGAKKRRSRDNGGANTDRIGSSACCASDKCQLKSTTPLAPLFPSFLTEFCGTLALTLTGSGSVAAGFSPTGVALAHGFTLFIIIEIYGYISGAHVNPVVTLAFWALKKITWVRALLYMLAQFAGAIAAGALLLAIFGGSSGLGTPDLGPGFSAGIGVLVEGLFTYGLVSVILNGALPLTRTKRYHAHLSMGLTLAAAILVSGPITGGALNPARALGPAIFSGILSNIWIYFVGPPVGAAFAVGNYWFFHKYYPAHCCCR